jgi:hypothetical protein
VVSSSDVKYELHNMLSSVQSHHPPTQWESEGRQMKQCRIKVHGKEDPKTGFEENKFAAIVQWNISI